MLARMSDLTTGRLVRVTLRARELPTSISRVVSGVPSNNFFTPTPSTTTPATNSFASSTITPVFTGSRVAPLSSSTWSSAPVSSSPSPGSNLGSLGAASTSASGQGRALIGGNSSTGPSSLAANPANNAVTDSTRNSSSTAAGSNKTRVIIIVAVSTAFVLVFIISLLVFLRRRSRTRKQPLQAPAIGEQIQETTQTRNRSASDTSTSQSSIYPLNTKSFSKSNKKTESIASFGPGPAPESVDIRSSGKSMPMMNPTSRYMKSSLQNEIAPYEAALMMAERDNRNSWNSPDDNSHIPISYKSRYQESSVIRSPGSPRETSRYGDDMLENLYSDLFPQTPMSALIPGRQAAWGIDGSERESSTFQTTYSSSDVQERGAHFENTDARLPRQGNRRQTNNDASYPTDYSYYRT